MNDFNPWILKLQYILGYLGAVKLGVDLRGNRGHWAGYYTHLNS